MSLKLQGSKNPPLLMSAISLNTARFSWQQYKSLVFVLQDSDVWVAGHIAKALKPHQWEGVQFLWEQIVMAELEVHKFPHLQVSAR